jgi:hypothetical protein
MLERTFQTGSELESDLTGERNDEDEAVWRIAARAYGGHIGFKKDIRIQHRLFNIPASCF